MLATAEPLPPGTPISLPGSVRLTAIASPTRPGAWSSLKSLSHIAYVLAAAEARRRGADDGLLIDGGRLLETTAANVFVVADGMGGHQEIVFSHKTEAILVVFTFLADIC